MVMGEEKLGCHDIFTDLSDVLPRKCRRLNFDPAFAYLINMLYHNDCVRVFRHFVAGIYIKSVRIHNQFLWPCF